MEMVEMTVVNGQGGTENIKVPKGTKINIEAFIVDSDGENGNAHYPILEIKNAIIVGEHKSRPLIALSILLKKQENIVMP